MFTSVEHLEDFLATPNEADVAAMGALDGDLLILGVAGKMGPTLALRAARAVRASGVSRRVMGVSRFSDARIREMLEAEGVATFSGDLLEDGVLEGLPDAPNVLHLAARKFGSTGSEWTTWAMNVYLPGRVAHRFRHARIVALSSGNIYPLTRVQSGGSTEGQPPEATGEYPQSAIGRERMFQYGSQQFGTPVTLVRLNYAVEMRYGVLADIGLKVFERKPVDLAMGNANVIWQGDANSVILRSFGLCQSPPYVLNLTGPETLSVRWVAEQFGSLWGVAPEFTGEESATALLNNAARCHRLFGYPSVTPLQAIEWTAQWIGRGGAMHGKPTGFQVRDGKF